MAYKKLSDFVLVKEYCDTDECTGHDCYCDSFTCKHWVREYVPLYIQQLIENGKLFYNDIQPRIIKGHTMKQEFEVLNNYIEERHEDWIGKTHIPVITADYEKIKEADEKPIDYKALKEFKEKVKEVERNINMNIYKNEPISIQEFETLKAQGKLDRDTLYWVMHKTNYKLDATRKWCSLSNAIIKKYKEMVDNNDYWDAISELNAIKDFLVENGYFKNNDFEDWGE